MVVPCPFCRCAMDFAKKSLVSLMLLAWGALWMQPLRAQQRGNCEPALAENYLYINNVRARILNNGNLFWRGDPFVYEVPKAVTGGSVHFVHIGSSGAQQVPVMLEMIDGARKHGIDITTEVYPYTAASTTIGAAVFSQGWRHRIGISFGDIQWLADGTRLTEKSFEYYRKEQPGGIVIAHFIPPAIVEQAVSHPGVMIVTDGGDWADNKGHPRGAGSFSRVLGTYVREKKTLTLMAAIRKMTLLPAQRLENFVPAMKFKGRIKSGADADITIFDPGTVQDKATYSEPMQYSEGIKHVLVGGEFVVMNEKVVEDAFPGKAIRR